MEMMYQYIWKHRMMGRCFETVDGRRVEVVFQGRHNRDAGPDFSGARLRIDGQEWAGNVEVHVKASDWFRHGHHRDPAYDNVILHAVGVDDAEAAGPSGKPLPQVLITFPMAFARLYARLSEGVGAHNCDGLLGSLAPVEAAGWTDTLAIERMQAKASRIISWVEAFNGDWERACFVALARSLGFGLNADPFEMLARSLPLTVAGRHSDNPLQLEALVFGQAGMLDSTWHVFDSHYQCVCREYGFLARKYGLKPIHPGVWKYSKTRPGNFPERRLCLLAKTLEGGFSLLSSLLACGGNPETTRALFGWKAGGYWKNHAAYGAPETPVSESLSGPSVELLLINFAAPALYAYGASHGNPDLAYAAISLWEGLRPERNSIVSAWKAQGLPCRNASDSQGLIQLQREYCERDRCLECRFGHSLLKNRLQR